MATKMSKTARASTVGSSKNAAFATSDGVPCLIATGRGKYAYVIVAGKTFQYPVPSPEFANAVEQIDPNRVASDVNRICKFYSDPTVFWMQFNAWIAFCNYVTGGKPNE